MRVRQIIILILLTLKLMTLSYILLSEWYRHAGKLVLGLLGLAVAILLALIANLFFKYMNQTPGDQVEL